MPSASAATTLATGPGSRVTRFAKSTAASVTPVRPGETHALSPLNNAMERHTVHVVLYLRAAPGLDREQLKESLSKVLSLYPAMTGRLTRGCGEGSDVGAGSGSADAEPAVHRGWVVKCNDAGVRMVDARAAVPMNGWLATATGDEEMDLLYYEPMGPEPYIWSPFCVQLTEFADKSYALGLSCTHMHNDPTAAALLFHAWAAAHRRTTSTYPPFLHAPALAVSPTLPPPAPPLLAEKASAASTNAAAMSSATFHFPASAVRAVLSSLEPGTTPFAAFAAFFWLRITGAADGVGERELTLALDFRKRMYALLPQGYYGSSVHFMRARRPRVRAPRRGCGAGPPRRRRTGGRATARPGVTPRAAAGGRRTVPDVRAGADVRGVRPRAHVWCGVRGRGSPGARVVPRGRAHRRGAGARPARDRGRRGAGRGGDAARGGDGQGLPRP